MYKLAFTIREVSYLTGLSVSLLYREINSGDLTVRKVGGRSVILEEDLLTFLSTRPTYTDLSG